LDNKTKKPCLLDSPIILDSRGSFSKPLHESSFEGSLFDVREIFWSTSSAGAIRGVHFQGPPRQIEKLVWVSLGSILDVVVDLRKGPTFGQVSTFFLDALSGQTLWVPSGFGHGFQSLENGTIVNYATDGAFSPEHEGGIAWDSLGVDWPLPPSVISMRDSNFEGLQDFDSPF
jgi:dTDP-4-dehydrorhamnose 3,5-epimerase